MNTLNKSLLTAIVILMFVTTVSGSQPSITNVDPENRANPIDTSRSQLDVQSVELAVEATNPNGGDLNVTFYTEEGQVIGEDTSSGPYSFLWDVDQFGTYSWYAEAVDSEDDTTTSDVRSFQVTNSDDTAPSVDLESTPDSPTSESNPTIEVGTNEDAKLEYSVDGGTFTDLGGDFRPDFEFDLGELDDGDHTVEVRAEDRAGNTRTKSFSFEVADGSEVSFQVAVDKSYPGSGIPIDPDSDVFDSGTEVTKNLDFDFSLNRNGNSYDISNDVNDGVCDFRGDPGWALGDNLYCGTKVPEDTISTDRTYELVAEWRLKGESHTRVLDNSFQISDTNRWYSESTGHGGRVQNSVEANTLINGDSAKKYDKTFVCKGSSYEIDNIGTVTAQCSNGVTTGGRTPPVVSFVSTPNEGTVKSHNDMFNDPDCNIEGSVSRQDLLDIRSDDGYYPPGCDIDWQLGGDTSFTAHTFNEPGQYNIAVDHVNAVSDSPQYICPADPNNVCSTGTLSGEPGWINLEVETVSVIEPSVDIIGFGSSQNSITQNIDGDTYIRRPGYDGDITGTTTIRNNGTGNITFTGLEFECPSDITCETITDTGFKIKEGDTSSITWEAIVPDARTTGTINVTVQYEDSYGVGCPTARTAKKTYYLDEASPQTGSQVVN